MANLPAEETASEILSPLFIIFLMSASDRVAFFNVALTQDEVVTIKGNSLAEADVQDDSVAMWLFDEGTGRVAKDSSGNGNDRILKNTPKKVAGKVGQALKFDGEKKSYVAVSYTHLTLPTKRIV